VANPGQLSVNGARDRPDILIVEDEVDLAATCVRFLRRVGYRPRVAQTGMEALALAEAKAPDLVLSDIRLPGRIDGLEVVRRLREADARIVVIVWTAYASDRSRQAALAAGAAAFLPKPFSLAELRATIDQTLSHSRLADENGSR
jgi:two-component system response regulator MprA